MPHKNDKRVAACLAFALAAHACFGVRGTSAQQGTVRQPYQGCLSAHRWPPRVAELLEGARVGDEVVELVPFLIQVVGADSPEGGQQGSLGGRPAEVELVLTQYLGTDVVEHSRRQHQDMSLNRQPQLGRRIGGRRPRASGRAGSSSSSSKGEVDTKAVREWAGKNGYELSARGRIPAKVVEAYRAAQR